MRKKIKKVKKQLDFLNGCFKLLYKTIVLEF